VHVEMVVGGGNVMHRTNGIGNMVKGNVEGREHKRTPTPAHGRKK
jgi:hypothetical protein